MFSTNLRVVTFILLVGLSPLLGGVSEEIEREYRSRYENRALFLKLPVRGERQVVYIRGDVIVVGRENLGERVRFKVGDQVRITEVDFNDRSVKFEVASIDQTRDAELVFQFGESLSYTFAQRETFERALQDSFTEGLTYQQIDSAKTEFIQDQFQREVNQFADITGTSSEFVLGAILETTPRFEETQRALEEMREEAEQTRVQLAEAQATNQRLQEQIRESRSAATESESAAAALQDRVEELQEDAVGLRERMGRLEAENRTYRNQLEAVAENLDAQLNSNTELGEEVENLRSNLTSLAEERTALTDRVARLVDRTNVLTMERESLMEELSAAKRRADRLQADLNSLTSNRDSLEATYLRTKERVEVLERARRLEQSVRLNRLERGEEGRSEKAEILLLEQPVAALEVVWPETAGGEARLEVTRPSPDTVEFDEETRELYEALGDELTLEAEWDSWSDQLQPILVEGEARQHLEIRNSATWAWTLSGPLDQSEPVQLRLRLVDTADQVIPVGVFEFDLRPAGLLEGWIRSFSWLWLGFGAVAGGVLVLLVGRLVGGKRRRFVREPRKSSYPSQKDL